MAAASLQPRFRITLRWKILLYFSALLVGLIVAMLIFVGYQASRFVGDRIASDLDQGRSRIMATENERLRDMNQTARLVASFPDLKSLLSSTDLATVKDFLSSYQQQNNGPDLLIVLDPTGKVVARTDTPEAEPVPDAAAQWVQPLMAGGPATGFLATQHGAFNAAAATATAGGTVFGFVIAGSQISDAFTRQLQDVSHGEVVILSDRVLGSTLAASDLPWRTRQDWEAATGGGKGLQVVDVAGQTYEAVSSTLGGPGGPLTICLQSRDRAIAPYRRIQFGLLILALIVAVLGISASAVLARSITAPVQKLVQGTGQVAAGNFDFRMEVRGADEIAELAQSFNTMIQGLRERADMQKFVSQSTVDMIQSSSQRKVSAGERKVLTIFFSDMRGFTSMSEKREPEEVVKVLNNCLSLQAEKVKKYSGDIDKYVGDAVVASFEGDDMALHAIRCAVEIHKALDAYNASQAGDNPIQLGIGIVTGEVIQGSIGSAERMDFTVIGSHVNLCARLCAHAAPHEILLAESTYRLVQDLVAAERLEPLTVKGFSEPVPVYRMTIR
ncbi:MAG TPA: adenylate/guanylate cyclase domain-containing protein [Terriglobia bacterium]|nr:adenylate/guanylate cyclase domain-containing protein [Terriglobia bacterium]